MRHALELALQEYEGAVVIISHDRHLLANTVDEFYAINDGNFSEFSGSIHDYEVRLKESEREVLLQDIDSKIGRSERKEARKKAAVERGKMAPLKKELKLLEKEIEKISSELKLIEEELLDENIYGLKNKNQLKHILERQGRLKSLLVKKEEGWYEVQKELEFY